MAPKRLCLDHVCKCSVGPFIWNCSQRKKPTWLANKAKSSAFEMYKAMVIYNSWRCSPMSNLEEVDCSLSVLLNCAHHHSTLGPSAEAKGASTQYLGLVVPSVNLFREKEKKE